MEAFKLAQGETTADLRVAVDKLQTKLARPGALTAANAEAGDADDLVLIDEATGERQLTLKAGQNFEHMFRKAGRSADQAGEASLADFVRGVAGMKTRSELTRKTLLVGTDASGGHMIPAEVMPGVLQALVPESTLLQAGARIVPLAGAGDTGAKTWTYVATGVIPTAQWRSEGGTVAQSEPTFRAVVAAPKSLAFLFKISRELLMDGANVDAVLMTAIAQAFAKEMDRVGLLGTGTAPEPRGLLNTSGVHAVANGANGASLATLRYGNLFSGALAILNADAPMPTAAIMAHRPRVGMGQLLATDNQPLMVPPMLANVRQLSTSQIPVNQTVGTSTDCTTMFLGSFGQMLFALRESMCV